MSSLVIFSWNPGGETGKKDGLIWSLDDIKKEMGLTDYPAVMVFQEASAQSQELKKALESLNYKTEYITEMANGQPQHLLNNKSYLWAWDETRAKSGGPSVHVNCDPSSNQKILDWIKSKDISDQYGLMGLAENMRWPVYKSFTIDNGRKLHVFSVHGSLKKDFAGVNTDVNCKIGLVETVQISQRSDTFLDVTKSSSDIVFLAGDFNLNEQEIRTPGLLKDFYLVASELDGEKWCHILVKGKKLSYDHKYYKYPEKLNSLNGVHQVMAYKVGY